MAFRSVSQDKTAAALLGIYVNRTMLLVNIVGCALGGVGGALFALYYTKVYPLMGGTIGMKAFFVGDSWWFEQRCRRGWRRCDHRRM